MSYRNPKIIIDRSGEIWGQAIAGFGKDVARGIDNYAAAKEKNQEIARKQKEAKQLTANGVSQKFSEGIEQASSLIKDASIQDQFKDTARMMANVGEEITVNGKSFKIGAIEAQTELKMNPNLDKDTRDAYSQIVTDFKGYQTGMVSSAGNIISGLDGLANSTTGMIGKTMDYQGQGFENTKSQVASYSILGKQMEGVTSKKVLGRARGEDGKYRNMLTINSSIDTNSKTFQELEAAGLISRDDLTFEEGSDVGSFSWERDLATWGEEGDLIVDIAPEGDTTESLKIAGFTDDKGTATGLGFNKSVVYSSRGVKGGIERTAEEHFDPDALRDNPAYDAELKGSAAGILALPLDQQIKYISNTLGWPSIKQKEWANTTPKAQQSFLMEQRFEKDLQKLMGAGGKNRVKTRDATSSDVAAYKADGIELDLLNEDGTPTKVYYTSKGNPSVTPYKKGDGSAGSVTQQIALKKYNDSLKNKSDAVKTAADKGSSLLSDTNSTLVNENIPGYGRVESAELNDGVLEFIYERKTGKRDEDGSLVVDRSDAKYDLKDERQLNTLANQLYEGDKNADKRKAFKKSIQLQIGVEKTAIGEQSEQEKTYPTWNPSTGVFE